MWAQLVLLAFGQMHGADPHAGAAPPAAVATKNPGMNGGAASGVQPSPPVAAKHASTQAAAAAAGGQPAPSGEMVRPAASPAADIERDLILEQILQRNEAADAAEIDPPAVRAIEREVERLRATADGMASEGHRTPEVIAGIETGDQGLENLGIGADAANGIRALTDEVTTLRAKLMLIRMRGASNAGGDAEFKEIQEVAAAPAHGGRDPKHGAGGTDEESAETEDAAPIFHESKHYPSVAARLLYQQGAYDRLIAFADEVGLKALDPPARYSLAAAYAATGELERARELFGALTENAEYRVIAQAAARQVTRIKSLELGVVGLDPLWTERNRR